MFLEQGPREKEYKIFKTRLSVDGCVYRCSKCMKWASIREGSFLDEFPGFSIMEIVKYIFYYYTRGYAIDDVLIENKGWYQENLIHHAAVGDGNKKGEKSRFSLLKVSRKSRNALGGIY